MKKHKTMQLTACLVLVSAIAVTATACKSTILTPCGGVVTEATTAPEKSLIDVLMELEPPAETEATEPVTTPTTTIEKDVEFHRALFSISFGGGFGTWEDTATITYTVYSNSLVGASRLGRQSPLAEMTREDFAAVASMVTCEALERIEIQENWDVCDGGSTDITIYDEYGQLLVEKGGYCVDGEDYHDLYWGAISILRPYIPEWWH